MLRMSWPRMRVALFLFLTAGFAAAHAEPVDRAALESWLAAAPTSPPAPGASLSGADVEQLRNFILPGYFDYVRNAGVHAPMVLPRRPWSHLSDHAPLAAELTL